MGDQVEPKEAFSESQQFDAVFDELVEDVLNSPAVKDADTLQAVKWFKQVSRYFIVF